LAVAKVTKKDTDKDLALKLRKWKINNKTNYDYNFIINQYKMCMCMK
jgi:hypothetical protein